MNWKVSQHTCLLQASGILEVEDNSSGLVLKSDPTGKAAKPDSPSLLFTSHLINVFVVSIHFRKLFKFIFYLGNMTGMVGTALYVSPEVQGNTKATYNQVQLTLKPFVMVYILSYS